MKKNAFSFLLSLMAGVLVAQEKEFTPQLTEVWSPKPEKVESQYPAPPSDAIVLFDGAGLDEWKSAKEGGEAEWIVADDFMTVNPGKGAIQTKKKFGDCQLHIEFKMPAEPGKSGQGKGNSGVFLQKRYEIQVLNSFESETYVNGQCGSVYKQTPPMVNASKKAGEWQSYDIYFTAPRFDPDGDLIRPAYVTVVHNGVLIQNHTRIEGLTVYKGLPYYEAHDVKQPLLLQDHSNKVSYRNIWIREL